MFGGRKRKATKFAVEAAQPLIRTLELTGGIPWGFWQDPYVLGFLTTCMGIFANLATNGKTRGKELGLVLVDALEIISGIEGSFLGRSVVALQASNDPDFLRGAKAADKTVSATYGLPGYEDDPEVLEARRLAEAMRGKFLGLTGPVSLTGAESRNSAVGSMLQQMLFYDIVRQRLGKSTD